MQVEQFSYLVSSRRLDGLALVFPDNIDVLRRLTLEGHRRALLDVKVLQILHKHSAAHEEYVHFSHAFKNDLGDNMRTRKISVTNILSKTL